MDTAQLEIWRIALPLLGAFVGMALASYFGVVAQRGWLLSFLGGSRCDHCGKPLRPWHNIPFVSAIMTRLHGGKSACCDQPLSEKYLWSEVVGALLGLGSGIWLFRLLFTDTGKLWFAWQPAASVSNWPVVIMAVLLILVTVVWIYLAVHDIWHLEVETKALLALGLLLAAPLYLALLLGGTTGVGELRLLGALLLAGLILALLVYSRGRGLGAADVVLMFLIGYTLGFERALVVQLAASLAGIVVGLVLAIRARKQAGGLIIPLVPLLALGWMWVSVLLPV